MRVDVDVVIVAMMALTVLRLVAGAEALWRRRGRRATADAPRPTAGADRVTAVGHPARRRPVGRQVSGAPGLAHAQRLPRRPAAGVARGIITIIAVYRTAPVMVVGETAEGVLLERSLPELADGHECRPPRLWQVLVEEYQGFQVRSGERRQGRTVPTIRPSATASGGDECPGGLGPLEAWTTPYLQLMPRIGRRGTCPWWGAGRNIAG